MKVTIFPREKTIFKAVSWYARHISPKGVDAFVDTIGEGSVLFLNKQIFLEGNMSLTPITRGNPLTTYSRDLDMYMELVIEAPEENAIMEFIEKAKTEFENKFTTVEPDQKYVKIVTWDGCCWYDEYKTPKRLRDSIYVPEFQAVLDDLNTFYTKSQRYIDLCIPYARTYMLHGLPGTGKTSMIYTLASELNKNLAIIDFSDKELSDRHIRHALYKVPKDTILCLEDIDSLFSENRKSDKPTITFSGILNILDGVIKNTGLVIFMTTNNLSNMDDMAMRRRVDYYIRFDVMKKAQITEMFTRFYPEQDCKKFLAKVSKLTFTPCVLQKFFVRHLDSADIAEETDELVQMCTNEYKLTNASDALYT
jgi:SpoVK/Ycf46/Vps4 family AAA+-type ATPase